MSRLLETFKLAFLSNIIKIKDKGNAQPIRLGEKQGDELMQVLVNEVFKNLLDEKKVTTIGLKQYHNRDVLPITTNFVAKFSKHDDVLFNRISLMRLISVCNLFLQDNNVGTLKRVQKKVDYEPDDRVVELLQNMQISRGNQDVVEAIEKQQISTTEELNSVKAAINFASAERKKEAADLKEDLQRYIEEMMKRQASTKRLKDNDVDNSADEDNVVLDDTTSDERSAEQNAKLEKLTVAYSERVKDQNKVEDQFNDNVTAVTFDKGQYIVTLKDKTKTERLFTIYQFDNLSKNDQLYLEQFLKIDKNLQLIIDKKLKKVNELIDKLINLRNQPSIDIEEGLKLVEATNKILNDLEYIHPKRSEIKSKRTSLYNQQILLINHNKKVILPDKQKVMDYYSFDEYSDDFEAASNDMSVAKTHFLKVIFDTLGMTGIESVTDALINYLNDGLQINRLKRIKYKEYYKEFYQKWRFHDDIVMERDKDVVKTLFADAPIDFDDDYLNIIGGNIEMNWISYMRIAVYEKYILMDFIENFEDYDIRGCMKEALNNFIYDHCYMSTLMFQNVS